MFKQVQIKEATVEDAKMIHLLARDADIDELWASAHKTPLEVMESGIKLCDAKVLYCDGMPMCMWGVWTENLMARRGQPWMVGTMYLDLAPMAVIRQCKPQLMEIFAEYDILSNYIDARNDVAIRWLKWLGFEVSEETEDYGAEGLPFHKFEMRLN